jgi:hypothetical protein
MTKAKRWVCPTGGQCIDHGEHIGYCFDFNEAITIKGKSMSDTDLLHLTFTRKQSRHLLRALKKRCQYIRAGVRTGSVDTEELYMLKAMIDDVTRELDVEKLMEDYGHE